MTDAPPPLDPALVAEMNRINEMLHGLTPFRLGIARPMEFIGAAINAHTMEKPMYDQLVANVRKDGNLSTVPFCWIDEAGRPHILSGHHRIDAARDAGIPAILYLYPAAELDDDQKTAIQLSHNSIFGKDDPSLLQRQWESIASLDAKLYSGLDERSFKTFEPVKLANYNEQALVFQTIELTFLPEETDALKTAIDKLNRSRRTRFVGHIDQHETVAEAIMRFKDSARIFNSSTAFMVMVEIASRYCDWLERAGAEALDDTQMQVFDAELRRDGLMDSQPSGDG